MEKVNFNYEYYTVTEIDGKSFVILEKDSKAICRLFIFNDNTEIGWISFLCVPDSNKRIGIGKFLLDICHNIAKDNNILQLHLNVIKDSWMHKWYTRLNFIDLELCEENDEYIHLTKNI